MAKKLIFRLVHEESRKRASDACIAAPAGYVCVIAEETRTLEQNALLWPLLREFSRQVQLPVNGLMAHLPEETWKDVMTAVFRGDQLQTVVYYGHMILTGASTSSMGKREFADFLTWILAEAVERDVDITRKAQALQDVRNYIQAHSTPTANVPGDGVHGELRRDGGGEVKE